MQTYLFYDIETTGLNKAFDQILQFAAIRTDLKLNELARYELQIKLNPDVIPHPRALITHQIGIKQCQQGISELDAITQIHSWLNEPGTISLGYNTLGFDDEFLRFSFYRNLLPPYTHQYANRCSRMDIYPMTIMYYLFKNPIIQWPQKNDKLSLKLEELNQANQFTTGQSHQAIVDVETTIALAKCFYQDAEMWHHLQSYFNKQKDLERIQQVSKEPALLVDTFLGAKQAFQSPVLYLGNHNHYKNQSLWLHLDNEPLQQVTSDTIKENTKVTFKKMGEPSFILPFKERFLKHMQPARLQQAENNLIWLQQHPETLTQIKQYYSDFLYPIPPKVDVQANLYQSGFWTDEELNFCRRLHKTVAKEKALLAENLSQSRLKQLATRLLGKNFPETLTENQKNDFQNYLKQIFSNNSSDTDHRGEARLTVQTALAEIEKIKTEKTLDSNQLCLLEEFKSFLDRYGVKYQH